MTNQASQPQPKPKKGRSGVAIAAILVVLGLLAVLMGQKGSEKTETDVSAVKDVPASDPVEVGDEVSLRYPASTILCEDRKEAGFVYMAGELAISEYLRMGGTSAFKAVDEQNAARKLALRDHYSCAVPQGGLRYRIEQKEITGTEKDLYHTVSYCLSSSGQMCKWLIDKYDFADAVREGAAAAASRRAKVTERKRDSSQGFGLTLGLCLVPSRYASTLMARPP